MRTCLSPAMAVVAIGITLGGCSHQSLESGAERVVVPDRVLRTDALTLQRRATKAKNELMRRLSTKLIAAMSEDGPEKAITVCSGHAMAIARQVGAEQGVRIGRTSHRLRNPNNAAPAWALPLIEQRLSETHFASLDNGTVVALFPIRLQAQCLACHGPNDQLADGVKERLAELYSDDRAVGFQDGDLRGWFWVEVDTPVLENAASATIGIP